MVTTDCGGAWPFINSTNGEIFPIIKQLPRVSSVKKSPETRTGCEVQKQKAVLFSPKEKKKEKKLKKVFFSSVCKWYYSPVDT